MTGCLRVGAAGGGLATERIAQLGDRVIDTIDVDEHVKARTGLDLDADQWRRSIPTFTTTDLKAGGRTTNSTGEMKVIGVNLSAGVRFNFREVCTTAAITEPLKGDTSINHVRYCFLLYRVVREDRDISLEAEFHPGAALNAAQPSTFRSQYVAARISKSPTGIVSFEATRRRLVRIGRPRSHQQTPRDSRDDRSRRRPTPCSVPTYEIPPLTRSSHHRRPHCILVADGGPPSRPRVLALTRHGAI